MFSDTSLPLQTCGIGVWVEVVIPLGETVDDPQIAACVENLDTLEVVAGAVIWPNWDWANDGGLILSGYIELYGIPSGTQEKPVEYRVIVWLERTTGDNANNGFPDLDEPVKDAEYDDGDGNPESVFFFPNEVGSWVEADAYLELFVGEPRNLNVQVNGTFVFDPFDTVTARTSK